MSRHRVAALTTCGAALVALTGAGLLFQTQNHVERFLAVAALQAAIYLAAVWLAWNSRSSRRIALAIAGIAILMRIPVVLAPPYLSNDVYRYVWDGRVEAAGFNPYLYQPADPQLQALRDQEVFPQIASQYAPTIYPPVAEAIFFIVVHTSGSVAAMKVAMVIFEALTFVLLTQLLVLEGLPPARILIYAWHPLPLWEFAGSGHIDAALIALGVAALWAVRRGRDATGGLLLAGATLTKFYPVILLPALYRRWDWRLPTAFVAAIAIAYLPFISAGSQILGFLPGYARQEGLDATGTGFYLLALLRCLPGLEDLGTRSYEVGAIGVLAALSTGLVFHRDRGQPAYAMLAVSAALFMLLVSPHYPWYFCWLIVFPCFVRSFALLWLTSTCLLLYLITNFDFAPSGQRLAFESVIYGPFAALAVVDFWYHRLPATARS